VRVSFDIQEGTITSEQAELLAKRSALWVFCYHWEVDVDSNEPPEDHPNKLNGEKP